MNEPVTRTFRVHLTLSEVEAVALSRLARVECRDLRSQAHYLLRSSLVDLGLLPVSKPEPIQPPVNVAS
jgi:hypothetical protein